MRINVVLASRGRPNALIAVIVSMWKLRSGVNDLFFVVGLDADDTRSINAVADLDLDGVPVLPSIGQRSTLGAIQNRCLTASDADAYVITTDRAFIITPGWDEQLRLDMAAHPGRVLWLTSADPDPTHPVIPACVMDRMGGKWSQEMFPFWWDDTWLAEIEFLTHGNIIKVPVHFAGERGKTTRLRDVAFWHSVFERTRPMRVRAALEAADIAEGTLIDRVAIIERMSAGIGERAEELEAQFGDTTPPAPEYLLAKQAAEELMRGLMQ